MSDTGAILETGGSAAVEPAAPVLPARGGEVCANCHAPLLGAYCAVCGQPRDVRRRSVKHLLHDLFQDLVSFDNRILRTARALLFQPGELPRAYHEGRTQPYVPAVRLYLFVSLLFFLVLSASHIALVQFGLSVTGQKFIPGPGGSVIVVVDGKPRLAPNIHTDAKGNVYVMGGGVRLRVPVIKADGSVTYSASLKSHFFQRIQENRQPLSPVLRSQLDAFGKFVASAGKEAGLFPRTIYGMLQTLATNPAALNGPLTEWPPRILFLLLPVFALLLTVAYWRRRKIFYFVDHLVFSLNFHSFAFVVLLAAALLAQALPGALVGLATLAALGLYLLLAIKRFYGDSWARTGVKFVAVGSIYAVFVLFPAFLGLILVSMLYG